MKKILLALTLSVSVSAQECPKNVQPIKAGEVANCNGFLFSPSAESDAWYNKELSQKLQKKTELQEQETKILEERLQLYMKQSDVLAKDAAKRDNLDTLYKLGYFALGALVTGYIAANVSK